MLPNVPFANSESTPAKKKKKKKNTSHQPICSFTSVKTPQASSSGDPTSGKLYRSESRGEAVETKIHRFYC